MDFRAAFIDIGAGPIACVKLSGGEAGMLISRKSAAPSVGEIKEGRARALGRGGGEPVFETSDASYAAERFDSVFFSFDILFA